MKIHYIYPGGHILDFLDRTVLTALHLGKPLEEALAMREDMWEERKKEFRKRFEEAMKGYRGTELGTTIEKA